MASLTLEQLVESVHELPSLPDVTLRLIQMADDPGTSARAIGRMVCADLALAARLLRIANSAYYGLPRTVGTINEAVVILGMRAVRNLALAAATYDTLGCEYAGYGLRAGDLWRHSMSAAMAAQILATRSRPVGNEEAFVGGLLHDVGKVVLNVHIAPQSEAIRALSELDGVPYHFAEKSVLGFDHAEVGARVAEMWNLPVALSSAIGAHHTIDRADGAGKLACILHVADGISHLDGAALAGLNVADRFDPAALEQLRLAPGDIYSALEEMRAHIERAEPLFSLDRAA